MLFPKWYGIYVYKKVINRKVNLKDPKEYSEKVHWLKIYSDTSQWTRLADKYKVREYVTQCGLEHILVRSYGVWERAEDIDFSKLPAKFVLKTNQGYGRNLLVMDKSQLDIDHTRRLLNKWVKERVGLLSFEPHYWNIERRIIAEEFLEDNCNGGISSSLCDYKFFCFHGEPELIVLMYDRQNKTVGPEVEKNAPKLKDIAFDLDWNPRHDIFRNMDQREDIALIPKPRNLDDMIKVSRILSKPFPQVRVDLYEVNQKIYFGELTFTTGGGVEIFTPEYYLEMGNKIDLSQVDPRTKRLIS